jgi:hypothetical protein
VESTIAPLLLMLLLARVDGKSPVEYLTHEGKRGFVRNLVRSELPSSRLSLEGVISKWFSRLDSQLKN